MQVPNSSTVKEKIAKQNINGNIYAWKYLENSRNYPGWNFTADKNGCESLLELLDLMKLCEWSSKKEIITSIPTEKQIKVPNNQRGLAKWKSISKLILSSKKGIEKNHWKIIEDENEIEIQFGEDKLVELEKAIIGIPNGEGDFAISNSPYDDDNIFYIWWNLEKE